MTQPANAVLESVGDLEWRVGTGRREALCSAELVCENKRTHMSLFLRVLAGNWQVVYEHRG
jgi:hypothetical protein